MDGQIGNFRSFVLGFWIDRKYVLSFYEKFIYKKKSLDSISLSQKISPPGVPFNHIDETLYTKLSKSQVQRARFLFLHWLISIDYRLIIIFEISYDVHRHKSVREKAVYAEQFVVICCCCGGVLIDEWMFGNVLKAKPKKEKRRKKKTRLIKPSKKRV